MKRVLRPRRSQAGFTLIELMISLVMFSLTIAGVLSVAVTITAGNREQRQSMNAESSVRVAIDFLADALRQASPGVPGGALLTDASGVNCTTGSIVVTNSTAAPDRLDMIYASGAVVTSSRSVLQATSTSINVSNVSQFAAGDHVVVADGTQGVMYRINTISGTTLNFAAICTGLTWTTDYPVGSLVIRAQHAELFIQNVDGIPTLMFDPDGPQGSDVAEPLAEGVEDLQVAVGIETGVDGSILDNGSATDEWFYNASGDVLPAAGSVRAVRVTLIARASTQVTGGVTPYKRPAAEDRPIGTSDGYRRRVLRSTIEIRNMGDSP